MRVTCVVDNEALPESDLCVEHGLSFLIECAHGRVLFDTGASGRVLMHNMDVLGIDPAHLTAVVLSHSHEDHTGGLPAVFDRCERLPLYAHPEVMRPRFSEREGQKLSRGLAVDEQMLQREADVHFSVQSQQVLPGIWTSGEIVDRTEPEGRSTHHFVRVEDAWGPDPYRDDLSLILESERGLILVCGCCHAGLLNTLQHVQRVFGQTPIAILGGTHLLAASQAHLDRLVGTLQQMGSPALYLNHCTGKRARVFLKHQFGAQVMACPAGSVIEF